MSFVNLYKEPTPTILTEEELLGPEPYDLNFVFPLHFPSLETDRVKLTPFVPRVHADIYWSKISKHPDLFRYYPYIWPSKQAFLRTVELSTRPNPNRVLLAIIDKTKPDEFPDRPEYGGGSLAGVIGFTNSSAPNLTTEVAFVAVVPEFQRTHVSSHAIGLLLKYCFELPNAPTPGLGLRRVEWKAHAKNIASIRAAERMGFRKEGVLRWHWVMPPALARDGEKASEKDKWPDHPGRHTVLLSVCWDDWENGVREVVQRKMNGVS